MNKNTLTQIVYHGGRCLQRLVLFGALEFAHSTAALAEELLLPAPSGTVGNHRSTQDQAGFSDEFPAHVSELDSFFLLSGETTKALWDEVRAWGLVHGYHDLPEGSGGGGVITGLTTDHPVVNVSWLDAAKWCNALSEMDGLSPVYVLNTESLTTFRTGAGEKVFIRWNSSGWRLPSEQEWELAARGGLASNDYPWSASSTFFQENLSVVQARYRATGSLPVESFSPNGFGLYDMVGNVAEWCGNGYDADAYTSTNTAALLPDMEVASTATAKSVRGGSWRSGPTDLRVAARSMAHPSRRLDHVGFRLARTQVPGWDAGYASLGGGWRRLSWFGDYIPMGNDGWIWHNQHGFLYASPHAEPANIWFFTIDMGWTYTESTLYPFLYRSSPSSWLWYSGSTNPRWFMNMTENRWEFRP